jgi:hypothetical protein
MSVAIMNTLYLKVQDFYDLILHNIVFFSVATIFVTVCKQKVGYNLEGVVHMLMDF